MVLVLEMHQQRRSLPSGVCIQLRDREGAGGDKCSEWNTVGPGERVRRAGSAILARMAREGLCWEATLRGTEGWVGENIWEASIVGWGSRKKARCDGSESEVEGQPETAPQSARSSSIRWALDSASGAGEGVPPCLVARWGTLWEQRSVSNKGGTSCLRSCARYV